MTRSAACQSVRLRSAIASTVTLAALLASFPAVGFAGLGGDGWTLGGSGTVTATTVTAGTLQLDANYVLSPSSALTVNSPGVLDMNTYNATVDSLNGNGTIESAAGGEPLLTIGYAGGGGTFAGVVAGPIALTKAGAATEVLSGGNTYTGGTNIDAGCLTVDGSLASSATVNSGAVLSGTGSLTSVTVSASGQIAPGDSRGALSVSGSLILESGAALSFGLDTPSTSSMIDTGILALNGQQFTDFTFTPTANFGPGTYDLIEAGSVSGIGLGANTSGSVDGYAATIAIQNNDLVLTVVPEPSSLALLGTGVLGLIGWARRRRLQTLGLRV